LPTQSIEKLHGKYFWQKLFSDCVFQMPEINTSDANTRHEEHAANDIKI